jgi:phosphoglycolate phosphatase
LKETGYRLACVTNKPIAFAETLLQLTGLETYFEFVLGGDSIPHMKPSPEPLFHACQLLKANPEHVLMVGDSAVDVAAARAAGMPVVIVRYGYPGEQGLDALNCDAFIDSLAQLAPSQTTTFVDPEKFNV